MRSFTAALAIFLLTSVLYHSDNHHHYVNADLIVNPLTFDINTLTSSSSISWDLYDLQFMVPTITSFGRVGQIRMQFLQNGIRCPVIRFSTVDMSEPSTPSRAGDINVRGISVWTAYGANTAQSTGLLFGLGNPNGITTCTYIPPRNVLTISSSTQVLAWSLQTVSNGNQEYIAKASNGGWINLYYAQAENGRVGPGTITPGQITMFNGPYGAAYPVEYTISPILPPPNVTGISPSFITFHSSGSVPITISGSNFGRTAEGIAVSLNGSPCPILLVNETVIVFTAPANKLGNQTVTLAMDSYTVNSTLLYTMPPPPIITGIAPSFIPLSVSSPNITIIGSNFGLDRGVVTISIGGSPSSILSLTNTTIVCTVPSSADKFGLQTVTLTIDSSTVNSTLVYTTPFSICSSNGLSCLSQPIVGTGTDYAFVQIAPNTSALATFTYNSSTSQIYSSNANILATGDVYFLLRYTTPAEWNYNNFLVTKQPAYGWGTHSFQIEPTTTSMVSKPFLVSDHSYITNNSASASASAITTNDINQAFVFTCPTGYYFAPDIGACMPLNNRFGGPNYGRYVNGCASDGCTEYSLYEAQRVCLTLSNCKGVTCSRPTSGCQCRAGWLNNAGTTETSYQVL